MFNASQIQFSVLGEFIPFSEILTVVIFYETKTNKIKIKDNIFKLCFILSFWIVILSIVIHKIKLQLCQ